MKKYLQEDIGESLTSSMTSTEDALSIWLNDKYDEMYIFAHHPEVVSGVELLLRAKEEGRDLRSEPSQHRLREFLSPWISRINANGFFVFSRDGISIASMRDENIGIITPLAGEANMFETCLQGEREFIKPFLAEVELLNIHGELANGEPTMFLLLPIFDEKNTVVAIFALRLDPSGYFSTVAQLASWGKTGGFSLFNEEGHLINESRSDDQLRDIGILGEDERSVLAVQLVDPGGDMTKGFDPLISKKSMPLTLSGKTALSRESGMNLTGYRDYRGVTVVGIWSWNHEFDFGLCFEVDRMEAYETYYYIRSAVLTALGIILVFIMTAIWLFQYQKTKVVRTSKSLEQSEAKFRLVMDSMDDAVIIVDTKGQIKFWPESAVKMFGFTESQALESDLTEVFLTDPFREKIKEEVELFKTTGKGTIFNAPREFVAKTSIGETFPAEHLSKIVQIGDETMVISVVRNISSRKEVEKNLKISDSRLKEAQQIAKLGQWEWEFLNREIQLSDEGYKIFGLKPQESKLSVKTFLKFIHPKDIQSVKSAFRDWLARKGDFSVVHRIVLNDSSEKTILQNGKSEYDGTGQLVRMVGTIQDISERVQQEKEFRLISERLQLATQTALVGVWDWDLIGDYLYWNDTMFTVYGTNSEDFTWNFEGWEKLIHPEDLEKTQQELQHAIDGNKAFHSYFRICRPDGEIRHIESIGKTEKDKAGKTIRIIGTNLDISDQVEANLILRKFNEELEERIRERTVDLEKANKAAISILRDANRSRQRAEEALVQMRIYQSEQQKLAAAIKSSPVVVMITDADWKIEYVNPRFTELTGYSEEEVLGETPGFLKTGNQPEEFFDAICRKLDSGSTWEGELENRKKDGTLFWEYVLFSPLFSEEGKLTNYVAVKEDITKRKEAQRRIEKALLQVEIASNAKSEFLANMSHEIRTPMNAILGFTEILDGKLKESTNRRYLSSIKSSGRLLLNLINDILDLSKVEAGKLEMSYDPVDFGKLLYDMQLIFAQKAQEKDLKIIIEISDKLPAVLMLDETRLRQVLVNLVGNAIKFTEEGSVKLSARQEFDENNSGKLKLIISIEDTGIGIPKKDLSRIFEAFEQVNDKRFSNREGTGLGLAISHNLVDLMNGDLLVQSSRGKGSVFTVTLNDVEISTESEFASAQTCELLPEKIVFKAATVLIADDIEDNRDLIKGYFETYPFDVLEAENGEQACSVAIDKHPDIILMDMKMPGMSGIEATAHLKDNPTTSDIPIIALTASAMTRTAKNISMACDGYLQKPVSRQNLIEAIVDFLDHTYADNVLAVNSSDSMEWDLSLDDEELSQYKELSAQLCEEAQLAIVLKKTMPMDKLETFAENLEEFASQHSLVKLLELAKSLHDQVLMFELNSIKTTLNRFIELSNKIST